METTEQKPTPRGTHHTKPLYLEEGPCLFEFALTKELLEMQQKRWAYIQTICGKSKRLLVKVWIYKKSKSMQVWADAITGTVYLDSGECLSSSNRKITKWGVYAEKSLLDKGKGRTQSQINWGKNVL